MATYKVVETGWEEIYENFFEIEPDEYDDDIRIYVSTRFDREGPYSKGSLPDPVARARALAERIAKMLSV